MQAHDSLAARIDVANRAASLLFKLARRRMRPALFGFSRRYPRHFQSRTSGMSSPWRVM